MVFDYQSSPSRTARTPLLSATGPPGVSQTSSQNSMTDASSMRYGPSATPYSASQPHINSNDSARYRAGGPVSASDQWDDDDMDDQLHTFAPGEMKNLESRFTISSWRGWANGGMLALLFAALLGIFAVYPIVSYTYSNRNSMGVNTSGYNLGGVNSTGQFPMIPGLPRLIDPDTPSSVYTRTGFDGEEWTLVFSDEFNVDGRTFYEGDDPFWTAQDLHYWPTNDYEWHDPSVPITKDGHLLITMYQEEIHDLQLKSGMINSWNKLCFNKNMIFEVSASMPGQTDVGGFWPGVWTMGNLGRAAYGATTEGTWPYSYTSCDIGTLPNQTEPDQSGPLATLTTGADNTPLSYLPGQRLSACTCPGEDHPGPDVSVGRAAPEIDLIEAQLRLDIQRGQVSQSYQIAPYDDYYQFNNRSDGARIYDADATVFNGYKGGWYQQAVSGLTLMPDRIYYDQAEIGPRSQEFATFSFEYQAFPEEREKGYIHWVVDDKPAWTMFADAIGPNAATGVGRRIITEEPMYLLMNLHASNNWQTVNWARFKLPNYMRIDYVRVWQRSNAISVGCDPADMPTADYIARHSDVYTNPNITRWQGNKPWPKNRLTGC